MRARWVDVRRALARPWRRCVLGVGLLALILVIDRWLFGGSHSLLATGIADETAHLSTMVILLLAFSTLGNPWFVLGCLAGSTLIDLDHIPLFLGSNVLTEETNRPLTHGLLTMGVVLAIAAVARPPWRSLGLGLAVGLAAHFLRDMATSTAGVPLLWPLSKTGFLLPYPLYIGVLAGAIAWTARSSIHPARSPQQHGPG